MRDHSHLTEEEVCVITAEIRRLVNGGQKDAAAQLFHRSFPNPVPTKPRYRGRKKAKN